MDIFRHSDYKKFVVSRAKSMGITYVELAGASQVQKSYISIVLRKDAHLNEQQAFDIGKRLGLDEEELNFFLLLVQGARAARQSYKDFLIKKINSIRQRKLNLSPQLPPETEVTRLEHQLRVSEYYLNPEIQTLHLYLLIPKYQSNLERIAQEMQLELDTVVAHVNWLLRLGYVERKGKAIVNSKAFVHIENGSTLSNQNHLNWRMIAMNKKFKRDQFDYRYSSTMVADKETKIHLMNEIHALIAEAQPFLRDAKEESVFQLNIDLFDL